MKTRHWALLFFSLAILTAQAQQYLPKDITFSGYQDASAAELLGKEKELGAVAPGYFADLVAVEGDPLADMNVAINNVRWVMKAGAVVVDKTKAQVH